MKVNLKDLIKPPFSIISRRGYVVIRDSNHCCLLSRMTTPEEKKFGKWAAAALNEKWERDFGEPLQLPPAVARGTEEEADNRSIIEKLVEFNETPEGKAAMKELGEKLKGYK